MSRTLTAILLGLAATALGCASVARNGANWRAPSALALVDGALAAHTRGERPSPQQEVSYEGLLTFEGHLRRPGDTNNLRARFGLTVAGDAVREDARAIKDGSEPETVLAWGSTVAFRPDPRTPWRAPSSFDAPHAPGWAWSLWPRHALVEARRHSETLADRGPTMLQGRECRQVWAGERDGIGTTLLIDTKTSLLAAVQWRFGHPRLGDVVDSVEYSDYQLRDGILAPTRIRQRRHEHHHIGWSDLTLTAAAASPAIDQPRFETPTVTPEPPRAGAPIIKPLFDRVWSVELPPSHSRSFIFEFSDHLICMEAPQDSPTGEMLIDAIRDRWPTTPIRAVVPSHYHPHYTGGLRAFIAAGIPIITTPGNEPFIHKIAARRFAIRPDRLAAMGPAQPAPQVEVVRAQTILEDSTLRVELHDIGPASDHTDEFLIAYLPAAGAAFHGDLGAAREDGTVAGRARLAATLRLCRERGLNVQWLLQSWPLVKYLDRTPTAAIEPQAG